MDKRCSKCEAVKPTEEFYIHSGRAATQCKDCEQVAHKRYYLKHRADVLRATSEWAANNPDRVLAAKARYNLRHAGRRKKRNAAWAAANPEKMKALRDAWRSVNQDYSKLWAQRNKEKVNSYGHNRRAKYVGRYTKADLVAIMARQRGLCANPLCRVPLGSGYNVDHVEAIVNGGSNWPDNIQLLCRKCNRDKDVKDPYEWAQQTGRLFVQ